VKFYGGSVKRGRERGFALIEVLMVAAIIGIMLAFSIPALGRFYLEYRFNKVASEVRADIKLARLKAVTSNFDISLSNLLRNRWTMFANASISSLIFSDQ
jgi:prepilin-type N-terminal cleavage/methylation domain-containing protein